MADSLSTALAMLRAQGPGRLGRFALARVRGIRQTRRWLAALTPQTSDESVVDTVTQRRLGEGQPVFAMQRPRELLAFVARVRALAPRAVLEIGTASGGTLLLLARAAAADATLVRVDLPGGAFGGGYAAWRRGLYRAFAGPRQTIALLRGNSHDAAIRGRVVELFRDRPVDLLLVDGDHTYLGARRDFLDYAPLVRPGGLVAFHDICADPAQPTLEVPRLWHELRDSYPAEELIEDRQQAGYGLGLLRMTAAQPGTLAAGFGD